MRLDRGADETVDLASVSVGLSGLIDPLQFKQGYASNTTTECVESLLLTVVVPVPEEEKGRVLWEVDSWGEVVDPGCWDAKVGELGSNVLRL